MSQERWVEFEARGLHSILRTNLRRFLQAADISTKERQADVRSRKRTHYRAVQSSHQNLAVSVQLMVCELGVLRNSKQYTHCIADVGIDRNNAFRKGLACCFDRHPICDTGPATFKDE